MLLLTPVQHHPSAILAGRDQVRHQGVRGGWPPPAQGVTRAWYKPASSGDKDRAHDAVLAQKH